MDTSRFFQDATLFICSSLEIDVALHRCFKYMEESIPMERMVLCLFEPKLSALRIIARADRDGGDCRERLVPLSASAAEEEGRVALRRNVLIVNDPDRHPVAREWKSFFNTGEASYLVMKLILDHGQVGTLSIQAPGKNRFNENHARLLSPLGRPFAVAMANALRHQEVRQLSRHLSEENLSLYQALMTMPDNRVVGAESGLKSVFDMVGQVAGVDSPVLLLGETGVGKDVVANAIHRQSPRQGAPFIKINCGAIPENLVDSELFGHEKGAFTGAVSRRRGCFERAHRGTLFLDEIGELPPGAQVRMLRVLQHQEIERVGGSDPVRVNVRIIAATNRDLEAMVDQGGFRRDLWFRLNVFPISIPPLRERKCDIPGLADQFVTTKARELKIYPVPELAPEAVGQLTDYHWPGNVRELENLMERHLILNPAGPLRFDGLKGKETAGLVPEASLDAGPPLTLAELNRRHIEGVLDLTRGRIEGEKGAARLLGLPPSTLRNRMTKLGISFGRKRNRG